MVTITATSRGMHIRLARVSRRLSQEQMAVLASVCQTDVSRIERDLPIPEDRQTRILLALELERAAEAASL